MAFHISTTNFRTRFFQFLTTLGSVSAIAVCSFTGILYTSCMFPEKFTQTLPSVSKNICTLPIFQPTKKDILGATTTPPTDLVLTEKKRDFWKKTIEAHPDYEDAYVQLVILSYQLDKKEDVYTYLSLLRDRNPNHALLKTLNTLVEKK